MSVFNPNGPGPAIQVSPNEQAYFGPPPAQLESLVNYSNTPSTNAGAIINGNFSELFAYTVPYQQTAAEIAAGVTPTNYEYAPGNVLRYGADPTGVADSTTAIINAVAQFASSGGRVILPPGTYAISSEIGINDSGISLVGAGRGGLHDTGTQVGAATVIKWVGGATGSPMVSVVPATGATRSLKNCDVTGILFDGGGNANVGLQIWSLSNSEIRICGTNCKTNVFEAHIFSGLLEASDCQQNDIWIDGDQLSAGDGMIAGFYADSVTSGTQGNFSFNRIWQISGDYQGASSSNVAVDIQGADNNDFYNIQLYRATPGAGIGVRCIQSSGTGAQAARANVFWHCSPGAGGFYSAGTEAGSYPAVNNNIVFYDTENAAPTPLIGTSSILWWGSNRAPAGLRVALNGANNQIQYSDGRMRYSGAVTIANGANFTITFPTAFPSSVLAASASANGYNQTCYYTATITGITIYNTGSASASFQWFVEGI